MNQLIAIALGGSAGAVARFMVANGIYAALGRGFPHGTLFVNVSGSFLMGFLTELLLQRFANATEYRAAILVGFLGAYTTFSTFALETLYLFEEGSLLKALLNVFLSTVLCLFAVWIGLILGRAAFAGEASFLWSGGLPHAGMALAPMAAFLLAMALELVFQRLGFPPDRRAALLIALLGVLTTLSSLWLAFQSNEVREPLQGLMGIFIVNALLGVAAVWLGVSAGSYLWNFKLSR
jgi:CrcB protein